MTLRGPVRIALAFLRLATLTCAAMPARAQQLIGYVSTRDATVTGVSDEMDGRAVLTGSASVTAHDHTAAITLGRGGTVRVCQTSVLNLSEGREAELNAPLLLSLDRGAIEIQMNGTPSDAIMTPDLRFTVRNAAPLDLRMRVARNGDTCVENRGVGAPTLGISDPFGEAMYELRPGQHVLFEHGSLHEVVDHETTPCGCPAEKGMSIADALLAPPVPAAQQAVAPSAPPTPQQAAAANPFPEAVSEGLAPAPEPPQIAAGEAHAVISDTLTYVAPANNAEPVAAVRVPAPIPAASGKKAKAAAAAAASGQAGAQQQPPAKDLVHAVGRFFKKLFGG